MGLGMVMISLMLVFGYLIVGVYIFKALEADFEIERQRHLMQKLASFLDKHRCLDKEKLVSLLDDINRDLDTARYVLRHNTTGNVMWDNAGSASFVVSVITTIGYGHITPKTPYGKIACMIYAIIGIPLLLVFLTGAGEILFKLCGRCLKSSYQCPQGRRRMQKLNVVLQGLLGLTILFVLPCSVNVYQEKWSALDAIYFCFISLTTIGFGDFIAGNPVDRDSFKQNTSMTAFRLINLLWTLLGLSYISMIITAITNYYVRKTHGVQRSAQRRVKDLAQRVGGKLKCKTPSDGNSSTTQTDLGLSGPFSLSVSSLQDLQLADNIPSDTHIRMVAFSLLCDSSPDVVQSSELVGETSNTARSIRTTSRHCKSAGTTPGITKSDGTTSETDESTPTLCESMWTTSGVAKPNGTALGIVKSSGTTADTMQHTGTTSGIIQSSEVKCLPGTSQSPAARASGVTQSSARVESESSQPSETTQTMASPLSRVTKSSKALNSSGDSQPLFVVPSTTLPSGTTQTPYITQSSETRQPPGTSSGDIQCTEL